MILAWTWFVILMSLSYGVAYDSKVEIRNSGGQPALPIALLCSGLAIFVTWEEIGSVAAKYIWNLLLPHGAGSSLALITAVFMIGVVLVITLIAPNICALMWHIRVRGRKATK